LKILVVAQDFPWPPTYGSRLRLVQVLEVACSLGDTDLFALVPDPWGDSYMVPRDLELRRFDTALRILPDYSVARRMRFVATPGLPIEVAAAMSDEIREQFEGWADTSYDVVWFSKGPTFHLVGRPDLGPTIVDLDDLEDQKITARIAQMRADGHAGHHAGLFMYLGAQAQARINASHWKSFQTKIAQSVDRVVLCSELDVDRFGADNAVVIPNGFEIPSRPAGSIEVGDEPTILLQGSLRYAPNADAARWLVTRILPRIHEQLPQARVRLVGDPDGSVVKLHDPPAVTVAGRVPSMEPELARADIVAVPMRYGSGTRVKILEAFAHRIPVVSTTLGAEGLGLQPGRHFVAADDPDEFADACVRLLREPRLRQEVADAAYDEFLDRHHWEVARARIRELFLSTARPGAA
jgi:glycosyltransferase involved in cell wall biosynthesis